VQFALSNRGYSQDLIDVVVSASNRRAIRAFQGNPGLPVAGLIDRKLIEALRLGSE
jgi:peptidoglycan hydrolase-like protein with peptidoglycan-binding domain